jgi:ArsR family transcriptional regulator, nickel/cobalt-responsive transcriptional repressor
MGMGKGRETGVESSCVELLKALADETRLGVVRELLRGERRVGELVDALGIEQSLLSHHLRILRDAGIVESERRGKAVVYRVAESAGLGAVGGGVDLGCCELRFEDGEDGGGPGC